MAKTSIGLSEIVAAGFQNFVDLPLMTPVNGAPSAGQFRSDITNRASIADMTKDLKPRMGIERIPAKQLIQLQTEFGPNGERVFALAGDESGGIRFVGGWSQINGGSGQSINAGTSGNDYIEVVFYGTGLNILCIQNGGSELRVSIDGGAESANLYPESAGLAGRNYTINHILNLASGLALGIHTAKIRSSNVANANGTSGFEVINASSQIAISQGSAFANGKKLNLLSQSLQSYNSGFESGTLGTRGGRVLTYLKSDGTVGKAVTPVNISQANLTSADHTNEEIVRTYDWREFGAGRADDYSTLTTANSARAFTLEDGTTTLVGSSVTVDSSISEALRSAGLNDYHLFTFVGTGLDINTIGGGSSFDNNTVSVDGVSIGTIVGSATSRTIKIVSGLPYGTHTVKILRATNAAFNVFIRSLAVYAPKKPVLPDGAIELADYCVMADYVAATTNPETFSTGTLNKCPVREIIPNNGAWSAAINTAVMNGYYLSSGTVGNYFEYTFFGTGIDIVANVGTSGVMAIQIDGVNFAGSAVATVGSWSSPSWTMGTTNGGRLRINGLTLGIHKLRLTISSVSGGFYLHGLNVVTPIHSPVSNKITVQNNLPVGSCSLMDARVLSPLEDTVRSKAWGQSIAITGDPTTTSTSLTPVPDMSQVIKFSSYGRLRVTYHLSVMSSAGDVMVAQVFVNGVSIAQPKQTRPPATQRAMLSDSVSLMVGPGTHKIDVYWSIVGGTMTANSSMRTLLVEEV